MREVCKKLTSHIYFKKMYNFIILSIYKTTNYGKLLTLKNVPSTTLAS